VDVEQITYVCVLERRRKIDNCERGERRPVAGGRGKRWTENVRWEMEERKTNIWVELRIIKKQNTGIWVWCREGISNGVVYGFN
jgi:hypothetical protein